MQAEYVENPLRDMMALKPEGIPVAAEPMQTRLKTQMLSATPRFKNMVITISVWKEYLEY